MSKLPSGWRQTTLRDLCRKEATAFTDGDWIESPHITKRGIRLIQTGNIGVGYFKNGSERYISEKSFSDLKCTEVYADDLLICRLADPIGRACIVPDLKQRYITSVDVTIARPDKETADNRWLKYALNSEPALKQSASLAGGSTRQRISRSLLATLELSAPPLSEQKKIADILSAIDHVIDVTEAEIEKLQMLKRAMMQELFKRGIGHKDFKDSPIGQIPVAWKIMSLGEITKHSAFGPRFPATEYNRAGNYLLLRTTDIDEDGNIDYLSMPRANLPAAEFGSHELQEGDITITRSGTCGIVSVFDSTRTHIPVLPGAFLIVFRLLREKVTPHFIKLALSADHCKTQIQGMAAGGVQQNLSGTNLKTVQVPVPPLQEQEQIANIIRSTDESLFKAKKRLGTNRNLKQALMQDLLTGKVRVKG